MKDIPNRVSEAKAEAECFQRLSSVEWLALLRWSGERLRNGRPCCCGEWGIDGKSEEERQI